MSPIYSTYRGPTEVRYLFIDGGYFREVMARFGSDFFADPEVPVDYRLVAGDSTKVFYYDCLAPRRANESDTDYDNRTDMQEAQFRKLRSLHGWHVIEGIVKGSGKRARQKEVDIQIAVDMLTHSYRRNMHRIAFIAGDQDFRPLIEAVVREGMFLELWYEESSASADLAQSADARRVLDPYLLHGFLDQKYQREHPLPERHSQADKAIPNAVLAEEGSNTNGERIELFQDGTQYLIVQRDQYNEGYFLHMKHPDLQFLKKVHAAAYGSCTWRNAV